jgi:hypothetical protein
MYFYCIFINKVFSINLQNYKIVQGQHKGRKVSLPVGKCDSQASVEQITRKCSPYIRVLVSLTHFLHNNDPYLF